MTLSSNTATTTLELGSTTNNTLRCDIHYGYDGCCHRYGHLNVTWYNDDIAINSNPAFSTSGTYLYVSSFGTYYSTLSFNGSVYIIHSGTYKCILKVKNGYGYTYGPIASTSVNLTVQSKSKSKCGTCNNLVVFKKTSPIYIHFYISFSSTPSNISSHWRLHFQSGFHSYTPLH